MAEASLKLVVFTMEADSESYEYGIPIDQVQEITRTGKTVKLPGTAAYLQGVMNLRGSVIPVIDLKKRCGLSASALNNNARIMVVQTNKQRCGIVVDDVVEIVSVPSEYMEDAPTAAGGISSDYIMGICKVEDRLIIAMDMEKILA